MRLFLAIALPDDVRDALALIQGGVPGANWTPVDNMHLTLRFLGETSRADRREVEDAVARALDHGSCLPFELALAGVGHFGSERQVRSLWASVADPGPVRHLAERLEGACRRAGFPAETRRHTPHVTLARATRAEAPGVRDFLTHNGLFRTAPFLADRVTLFSSHLGRPHATYRAETEFPLGGAFDWDDEWGEDEWEGDWGEDGAEEGERLRSDG